MPTVKKPGAAKPRARTPRKTTRQAADIWARTQMLVEVLLEVMESEVRAKDQQRSEQWLKLFGPKDSAVVNLQKLVQLLAVLQGHAPAKADRFSAIAPVDDAEIAMLADWIRTQDASAASASPVTE